MIAVCSRADRYHTVITSTINVTAVNDQTTFVGVKLCCACQSDHLSSFVGQRWDVERESGQFNANRLWHNNSCSVKSLCYFLRHDFRHKATHIEDFIYKQHVFLELHQVLYSPSTDCQNFNFTASGFIWVKRVFSVLRLGVEDTPIIVSV